jgi:hypothetical protein
VAPKKKEEKKDSLLCPCGDVWDVAHMESSCKFVALFAEDCEL